MKKIILIVLTTILSYSVEVNDTLPTTVIPGKHGGTVEHQAWNSDSLKGKVHTILYMDPDKREATQGLLDALGGLKLSSNRYTTVAIINLAATWLPNSIIQSKLKSKQKDLKNMEYIFDKDRYLVKKWNLKDNDSNVIITNSKNRVVYQKSGNFTQKDIKQIISIIKNTK